MTVHEQASRSPTGRSAAVTIALDVPVEAVWRALTDPNELVNWFPTNAAVDPRPGGAFVVSWNGQWQWEMAITDFEALAHIVAGRVIDRPSS